MKKKGILTIETTKQVVVFDVVVTVVFLVAMSSCRASYDQVGFLSPIPLHLVKVLTFFLAASALCCILVAGLASIYLCFANWQSERLKVLIAPLVYVCCIAGCVGATPLGIRLAEHGTPMSPETFWNDQRRIRLEEIALFSMNEDFGGNKMTSMSRKYPLGAFPPDVQETLKGYGFSTVNVDKKNGVVSFGRYRLRTWHHYIYLSDADAQLPADEWYARKPLVPLDEHWYYSKW